MFTGSSVDTRISEPRKNWEHTIAKIILKQSNKFILVPSERQSETAPFAIRPPKSRIR